MQEMVDSEKTVEELDEIESKLDEQLASAGFLSDRLDCAINIVLILLSRHNHALLVKLKLFMDQINRYPDSRYQPPHSQ